MNIGIDARVLEKKMTGVGRLLLEYLKYIPELDKKNKYFLFSYNKVETPSQYFQSVQTIPTGSRSKFYSPFWLIGILPRYLKAYDIDIFFTPNSIVPFRTKRTKWKSIIVVHDTFSKLEERFLPFWYTTYMNLAMPIAVRQSAAIIAISQNTKNDVCKYFGTDPGKIHLSYRAADDQFRPRSDEELPLERLNKIIPAGEKFVLYVGMIEIRKNITTIIRVADLLMERGITSPILLVGQPCTGSDHLIPEIRKRKNMIYLSYVEDGILPFLYNRAEVFFFPSLYEGFGLPPLEAMQSGTPVVASAASSLPEVIGDGGVLCEPYDAEGFADAIGRLLTDPEYHAVMREKGLRQAQKFDQRSASVQLVKLFNSFDLENPVS